MSKVDQDNLNFLYGYRCNYSCLYCSSGSDKIFDDSRDPDFYKTLKSISRSAELFNVTNMVALIGGEPFLYWESRIIPMALEINRCFPKTRINILSNGQLLGQNIDKIIDLSSKIDNLSITISRHLIGVEESKIKNKWRQSIDDFINHPSIVKIHEDHYHIKNNICANIYFFQTEYWKTSYYINDDGKIKPWATNNPEESMKHGCLGHVCPCIIEDKLYKCSSLATLNDHLTSIGQEQDPDWAKYLGYPALDLNNIDQNLFDEYVKSYSKPVTYCDMCSDSRSKNIKWENRTFPLVFTKIKNTP